MKIAGRSGAVRDSSPIVYDDAFSITFQCESSLCLKLRRCHDTIAFQIQRRLMEQEGTRPNFSMAFVQSFDAENA